MFDIGWTEMLVIAVIMIVIVGPKDLPKMLRTFGQTTKKLRGMAGDFQKQFNEALKEAELDGVKESVDAFRSLNPANEIKKQLNPFEKAAADVRSGLDTAMKPKPSATSSEPLKSGATAVPGAADQPAKAAPAGNFPAMEDPSVAKASGTAAAAAKPAAAPAGKGTAAAKAAKPAAKPAKAVATKATSAASKPAAAPVKAAAKPAKAATPKKKPAGNAK